MLTVFHKRDQNAQMIREAGESEMGVSSVD